MRDIILTVYSSFVTFTSSSCIWMPISLLCKYKMGHKLVKLILNQNQKVTHSVRSVPLKTCKFYDGVILKIFSHFYRLVYAAQIQTQIFYNLPRVTNKTNIQNVSKKTHSKKSRWKSILLFHIFYGYAWMCAE